jgi:hypothetical protein
MNSSKLKIEIITHREATQAELAVLDEIIKESRLQQTYISETKIIRRMGASLPPEILIIIWLAGPVMVGFLEAIGQDLWRSLKIFIQRAFKRFEDKKEPEYNPHIRIEIRIEVEPKVQIVFPIKSSEEIKKGLEAIDMTLKTYKQDKFLVLFFYKGKWISQDEYLKELKQ